MNIVVLGLGNVLVGDEGVGVWVVEELKKKYAFTPPVKIIDGGTLGFALINEIDDCRKLIVVDAVQADQEPGTIYRFTKDDVSFKISQKISAHDMGFAEALSQWKVLGIDPEIVFLGIEPQELSAWKMALSECIRAKAPRLVELVLEELKKEGIAVREQD